MTEVVAALIWEGETFSMSYTCLTTGKKGSMAIYMLSCTWV